MKNSGNTRHVDFRLYAALNRDIAAWDFSLRAHLDSSLERLRDLVVDRGPRVLLVDFPEMGKALDKGLSSGQLDREAFKLLGSPTGSLDHLIYGGLLEQLFFDDGALRELDNDSPTAVMFIRQVLYMFKKISWPCPDEAIKDTMSDFEYLESNLIRDPSLDWNREDTISADEREPIQPLTDLDDTAEWWEDNMNYSRHLSFLDEAEETVDPSISPNARYALLSQMEDIADRVASSYPLMYSEHLVPKHGPGSVADARNDTDKYHFPYWPAKLERVFPQAIYGQHRVDVHLEAPGLPLSSDREPAAKLIAVPKTYKGPRLIASEPTAHQYMQQAVGEWLRKNLPQPLNRSISFNSQEPSRQLCLKASVSGRLATVDLSSASDRLSLWCVERFFRTRADIISALWAVRSRSIEIKRPGEKGDGVCVQLKKYAPQGSAVTFPLQTIIYATAAIAAVVVKNREEACSKAGDSECPTEHTLSNLTRKVRSSSLKKAAGQVRVFGDDIIVPTHAVPYLRELLSILGLRVNESKTHSQGYFRESCGMDAFTGDEVTPVYVPDFVLDECKPKPFLSWVAALNNAWQQGLWHLSHEMEEMVPPRLAKRMPVTGKNLGCLTLYRHGPSDLFPVTCRLDADIQDWTMKGVTVKVTQGHVQREDYQSVLDFLLSSMNEKEQKFEWVLDSDELRNLSPDQWLVGNSRVTMKTRWVSIREKQPKGTLSS